MSYIKNGVKYDSRTKDVAGKYSFSEGYVRDLAASRKIPSISVGRTYWFNLDQVEDALIKVNRVAEITTEVELVNGESHGGDDDLLSGL